MSVRRIVLAIPLALLALAPAAAAKGPHASISPGPTGIQPGRTWVATLTLREYGRRVAAAARPVVIFRRGDDEFRARPRRLGAYVPRFENVLVEARYRLRVVFPRAGRWSYTVLDRTPAGLRFRFPPALVGGNAERITREVVAAAGGLEEGPLRPEVMMLARDEPRDEGVAALWILAAIPFAGAGILALRKRRRRSA
jgi:hypothetical protein